MPHYDTIIIGAGMSGLAAGIRLAMFDRRVVILERHNVWGGLNSFYNFEGHQFDVGLHAMTNYARKGARGLPLTKLLKQLRIRHSELDLYEQGYSRISFPSASLKFSNEFELLRSEVARAFPRQADAFDALTTTVREYNELDLEAPTLDARAVVAAHIGDPLLADMIFCPLAYYGSARENEMDWAQFVIMFKSIFLEGFSRPQAGVRHIIKLLIKRYRECGGEMRMSTGVAKIETEGERCVGVQLDDGTQLTADTVLSSAGLVETRRMLGAEASGDSEPVGRLSFTESISLLDCPASRLGIEETIIFFNNSDRFNYARPDDLCDTGSGVICMPGNFQLPEEPRDHLIRITNIANYDGWAALERSAGASPALNAGVLPAVGAEDEVSSARAAGTTALRDYHAAKQHWYARSCNDVLPHVADFREHTTLVDMFTPRTIRHYTGHIAGAVYGSPTKKRTGEMGVAGLYIIGTDQGFLGIVGAMLSGISMANRWVLQGDSATVETN